MEEVIIIGGGLSGLTTAYELKKKNISFKIFEAQNRLGGRIETILGNENTPMEMGATWFSREHLNLIQFLSEIKLDFFDQYNEGISFYETTSFEPPQQYTVPANTNSAYRIQGGTFTLIESLKNSIGIENIVLDTTIVKITDCGDSVELTDNLQQIISCKQMIIAIPPKLVANTIEFSPALPQAFNQVLQQTQTWMSGSIKFAFEYSKAFWKAKGYSGSVFSQLGLAVEIYDHSTFNNTKFALMGFLNGSAIHCSFEERKQKVLIQLKSYFGPEVEDYLSYSDKIWDDKFIQPSNDTLLPPHYNNGNTLFYESYMNNKLFFAGTETSKEYSGYMEGAIISGKTVVNRMLKI